MITPDSTFVKNWAIGTTLHVLEEIHLEDVNIAICNRDLRAFDADIKHLIEEDIQLRSTGDVQDIIAEVSSILGSHTAILEDITELLHRFQAISKATSLRFLLSSVKSNMCRKFHTDINDLRMLCTYRGPGTMWLKDDNINPNALDTRTSSISIVINEDDIQQVPTGSVSILKGALYPNATNGVVHRSPIIEETGERRLLLRIDTYTAQDMWK